MRRLALAMFCIAGVALVALCAMLVVGASQPPPGLVPEGAQQVSVQRLGIGRQRVTYTMPPDKTMSSIRQSLLKQGWRRLQGLDEEVGVNFFARSVLNRTVRVIATVRRPATTHDPVTVDIVQCVRFGDRLICL